MNEYTAESVKTADLEMKYTKFGKGKRILVILPGISFRPVSATPEALADSFKDFIEDYTVYCLDRKENMPVPYSVEEMAEDTVKALNELGIRKFDLYGASQGGMMALYIALKYPDMVRKLIVASSGAYMSEGAVEFFERINGYLDERNVRSLVRYCIGMIYTKEFCDACLEDLIEYYGDLSDYELKQFKAQVSDDSFYILDKLDKIKAKTLLIAAEGDKIFGISPTLQMAYKMGIECVIYDGYSHAVYDEAEDMRKRMLDFLA